MPSAFRRTQDRAINFSRSFANAIRSKLIGSRSRAVRSPLPYVPLEVQHEIQQISRPRNLRRTGRIAVSELCHPVPYPWSRHHPIHRLPVELLAHIFVLGTEDNPHIPLSVSQVCRSWRQIALSTPSLWRRIVLSPHQQLLREYIRRARACSLDIELLPTALSPIRPRPLHYYPRRHLDFFTVQWLMQIALPHIHRWRSLDIVFTEPSPYLLNAALSFLVDLPSPPSLREITVIHRLNEDPHPFPIFNGHIPSLRKLVIDGLRLSLSANLLMNLTFLDYTHHRFNAGSEAVQEVLTLLSLTPKLVSLRMLFPHQVTNIPPVYHNSAPNTMLSLSHLRQLRLSLDPLSPDVPYDLALLLSHIATPVLHTLRFSDPSRRRIPFPNLKSFFWMYPIPRSLRFMYIEGGWFDQGMVDPIVKSLPRLRRVMVRRGGRGTEHVVYNEPQARSLRRVDALYRRKEVRFVSPDPTQMNVLGRYQDHRGQRYGQRQRATGAGLPRATDISSSYNRRTHVPAIR